MILKADKVGSADPEGGLALLKELVQNYDEDMTVHTMTVDQDGLHTSVIHPTDDSSSVGVLASCLR